jgi:hypothetical protein
MHESSLPTSDRTDAIEPPRDRRPALVIRLADARYFKAWRRKGNCVSVRWIARSRLFWPSAQREIDGTIAKLRRKGIVASVVEVKIVGQHS